MTVHRYHNKKKPNLTDIILEIINKELYKSIILFKGSLRHVLRIYISCQKNTKAHSF